MNPELQRVFDGVPEDEPRSRLEAHRELILQWRRQGRTYRRIQQLLTDKCSLSISLGMLHKFVRTRSRPRKPEPELRPEPIAPTLEISPADRWAVTRARMYEHKTTAAPLPRKQHRFEYTEEDAVKPLY